MPRFGLLALPLFAALLIALPAHAQQAPRFGDLHDALHLTPAQEDAWRDFQTASQPDAGELARQRSAQAMLPTLTAPQRVDLSMAVMESNLQALRRRGAALKTFYAVLTPQQQLVFDRQTAPRQQ